MYDVVIVGAGPAGSSAAYFLAKKGLKVVLVDKASFPRDKSCADGIGPRAVNVLQQMNVTSQIEKQSFMKTRGGITSSPNETVFKSTIPTINDYPNYGYVVPRKQFDTILKNHVVTEGVDFIDGFTVTDPILKDKQVVGVSGSMAQGEKKEIKSKIVICADGANSLLSKKFGFLHKTKKHTLMGIRAYFHDVQGLEKSIEFHYDKKLLPCYGWIFPISLTSANVGLGIPMSKMQEENCTIHDYFHHFVNKNVFAKEKLKNATLEKDSIKGWPIPTGGQARDACADGIMAVGDAASFVDPMNGEGTSYALESGKMAATVALTALEQEDYSMNVLQKYNSLWKEKYEQDFKTAVKLRKYMKNERFFNFVMKQLTKDEEIGKIFSGVMASLSPKKEIMSLPMILRMIF